MFAFFETRRRNKPVKELQKWIREHSNGAGKRFIFLHTELRFCFRVKDLLRTLEDMTLQYEKLQKQRRSLTKQLRADPLFDRMEDVFCICCTELIQTLEMCIWERMRDAAYPPRDSLQALIARNKAVMHNYGDYLFALTQATFRDTTQDRETIARTVQAMTDVVRQQIPL